MNALLFQLFEVLAIKQMREKTTGKLAFIAKNEKLYMVEKRTNNKYEHIHNCRNVLACIVVYF